MPSSEEEQEVEVVKKYEYRSRAASRASQETSVRSAHPLLVPRRFKTEPSDSIPVAMFDAPPVVKAEPIVIDLTISDSDDNTQPVPMTRKRSRTSKFSTPSPSTSSSGLSSPSESSPHSSGVDDGDDGLRAWPSSFYVVDIVRGFEKCEAAARGRKSVREAFIKFFQVPFRHTTFYTHRRHWEAASQACRDDALRAGHKPAGTWTAFLERSRSKPTMEKKKNKKRVKV